MLRCEGAQGWFTGFGTITGIVLCRHVTIAEIGLAAASDAEFAAGLPAGFQHKDAQASLRGLTGAKEACSSGAHDDDMVAGATAEGLWLLSDTNHAFMMARLGY